MAPKKNGATMSTSGKPKTSRYRGLYLQVTLRATTRAKKPVEVGQVLLAVGDPGDDGWVPVLFGGRLDHVQRANVVRIVPTTKRPTAKQLALRKGLVRRALAKRTAKPSKKPAKRNQSKWSG